MAQQHRLLFLDFETFYSDEYSLTKLSPPEYILDPRYETIMCAAKVDDGPSFIVDGPDFDTFLKEFDPANTTTVTFNALFDNCILAWRYGFIPSRMLDSMGMARALRGHSLKYGSSLKSVAKALGLPAKLDTLIRVKGMRRADIIAAGMWRDFSVYANNDNELNAAIFDRLSPEFPVSERRVMDLVLRAAIAPRFAVDTKLLQDHLIDVRAEKEALLAACAVDKKGLMSTAGFQKALEDLGVEIEFKPSITNPEKNIPAFAKSDDFMAKLAEHIDPRVQALAAARLGHKSTLEETRAEKLLRIASLDWGNYCHGNMPIPLRYGGAHTHRLSGDWGMNMQNMPSSRSGKSKLRKSLLAQPGYSVVVSDLAQIEARLCAWICGETGLTQQFANKEDPYMIMGAAIFGCAVDKNAYPLERFIGKTAILGLGYGCGKVKFYDMVIKLARVLKVELGDRWTEALAEKSVNVYRTKYAAIQRGWQSLDSALWGAWLGRAGPIKFGPCVIDKGSVLLPNGMYLSYENPRVVSCEAATLHGKGPKYTEELMYDYGKFTHKIYGAKMLENIVQALARIVVMNAALRLRDRGYYFVLQAHDELAFLVPDSDLDNAKTIIHTEMTRRPSWAPNLPLSADTNSGKAYGDAK